MSGMRSKRFAANQTKRFLVPQTKQPMPQHHAKIPLLLTTLLETKQPMPQHHTKIMLPPTTLLETPMRQHLNMCFFFVLFFLSMSRSYFFRCHQATVIGGRIVPQTVLPRGGFLHQGESLPVLADGRCFSSSFLVAGEEGANFVTFLIALCVIDVSLLLEFVISDVINVCSRGATLLLPCDVSIQKSQAPAQDDPYFFAPIDDFSAELHAALDISRIEARGNDLTHAVMREALTNHLSESNLEIAQVAADGDCQFLAVARAADSLELEHRSGEVWRMRVAFELLANREQYEPFHIGDFNSYVENMATPGARVRAHQHHGQTHNLKLIFRFIATNPNQGTWGDNLTLQVMSNMLRRPFSITRVDAAGTVFEDCITPSVEYDDGAPLTLAYWSGLHYDAVVPKSAVRPSHQGPMRKRPASDAGSRKRSYDLSKWKIANAGQKFKQVCDEALLDPVDKDIFSVQTSKGCTALGRIHM